VSRPEIAIHKKNLAMEKKSTYLKRSQKDYSLSLKLQIVQQIERGQLSTTTAQRTYGIQARSTVINWLRKYGNFDWENQTPSNMPKSPEQKIMELEAKVKLLEKQKALLENQTHIADSKVIIFDMMIKLAEQEYQIDIRKNLPPGQSNSSQKSNNKQ
jgi:transposase-like protein